MQTKMMQVSCKPTYTLEKYLISQYLNLTVRVCIIKFKREIGKLYFRALIYGKITL